MESSHQLKVHLPVACSQAYELLACWFSPRLRGPLGEMVAHHVVAGFLSTLISMRGCFQHYAVFFTGVAEVSSVPLAVVDLFKHFPRLREHYRLTNEVVRNVFAATFLACRTFAWSYVSLSFWRDSFGALGTTTTIENTIYIFMVCNVGMTLLQWYWSWLILEKVYQKVTGDPKHRE